MGSEVTDGAGPGLVIPPEVAKRVNSALADAKPIVVGYVTADGRPTLSLRGSTHVHSDDQIAIWVRHAQGGFIQSVAGNPQVCLLYRDSQERTTFVFSGRAHVADDEPTRETVYDAIPQVEKDHDPERSGAALIIDIDRLQGGTVGGAQVSLERQA
jgi:Pyridoxamine 5'-phosphate oxidase